MRDQIKADGTFVISKNGHPYHVTHDMEEFTELTAKYKDEPSGFDEYIDTPYIVELSRKDEILLELESVDRRYRTPRTVASAQLGDEGALDRLKKAEELSEKLRLELKGLESVPSK